MRTMTLIMVETEAGRRVLLEAAQIEFAEPVPADGPSLHVRLASGLELQLSPAGRRTLMHRLGFTTDPFAPRSGQLKPGPDGVLNTAADLVQPAEVLRRGAPVVSDPDVPLPVGLREMQLTEADAAEIRRRLDDPARPRHQGQEMADAPASSLKPAHRRVFPVGGGPVCVADCPACELERRAEFRRRQIAATEPTA
jgi:hypothetical protein